VGGHRLLLRSAQARCGATAAVESSADQLGPGASAAFGPRSGAPAPDKAALHPAVVDAIVDEAKGLLEESQRHWSNGELAACAERCHRVASELLGPDRPEEVREALWQLRASAHVNGACALKALQRHEEALVQCEAGLEIMKRRLTQNRQQVIQILDLSAELALLCSRPSDGDKYAERALSMKEAFPWHQASMATSWNLRAQACVQQGDVEKARGLFAKALAIHVKMTKGGVQGALPAAAAVVLSNYAGALRSIGGHAEAAKLYQKAIDIFEAANGPESEALGRTLVELGATYIEASVGGRTAAAPLTRAMLVLSAALGEAHPSVGATASWLAKCKNESEEASEAALASLLSKVAPGCPVERLLADQAP